MMTRPAVFSVFVLVLCSDFASAQPIFRDDFDGPQLVAGWTVIRPDPSTYSLATAPGYFQILTSRGLLGEQGTARNLLVRPITGNFILETRLEFNPRDGQPFAGLLVYQDDGHAVSIGMVYASGERGQFRGIVMLNVGDDIDLTNRPASRYDESNTSSPNVVFLRLLRQGNQFVGAYSDNGVTYRELGTVINPLESTLSVGVGAANGDSVGCGPACDVPIPARFDYFQISDLSDGGVDPPPQGMLSTLSIEGPESMIGGATGAFRAIALYVDGDSEDVSQGSEWIVAPPGIGFVENGLFQAAPTNSVRMATLVATYSQRGELGTVTRSAARLVRINPRSAGSGLNLCGAGMTMFLPLVWAFLTLGLRKPNQNHGNARRGLFRF